jgi:hypothetical protein
MKDREKVEPNLFSLNHRRTACGVLRGAYSMGRGAYGVGRTSWSVQKGRRWPQAARPQGPPPAGRRSVANTKVINTAPRPISQWLLLSI